jgi:chaperonin GroEL
MNDIAVITGATVISEEVGLTLEKSDATVFGRCKNVTITKDDTIIMNGFGEKSHLEERVQSIKD